MTLINVKIVQNEGDFQTVEDNANYYARNLYNAGNNIFSIRFVPMVQSTSQTGTVTCAVIEYQIPT